MAAHRRRGSVSTRDRQRHRSWCAAFARPSTRQCRSSSCDQVSEKKAFQCAHPSLDPGGVTLDMSPPRRVHARELYVKRVPLCDRSVTLPLQVHMSCTCSRAENSRNRKLETTKTAKTNRTISSRPCQSRLSSQTKCRKRSHSSKIPEQFRPCGVTMAVSVTSCLALKHPAE